jgi:hypothetical protein
MLRVMPSVRNSPWQNSIQSEFKPGKNHELREGITPYSKINSSMGKSKVTKIGKDSRQFKDWN